MVVKNTKIYGVQISGKRICKSKDLKEAFLLPPEKTVTGPYHHPQRRDKLLIPPVKADD